MAKLPAEDKGSRDDKILRQADKDIEKQLHFEKLISRLSVWFFLGGGLVTHWGVKGWWIEPVLGILEEIPLMLGATILTAFNYNAAITYLRTLVPGFTDILKYDEFCFMETARLTGGLMKLVTAFFTMLIVLLICIFVSACATNPAVTYRCEPESSASIDR